MSSQNNKENTGSNHTKNSNFKSGRKRKVAISSKLDIEEDNEKLIQTRKYKRKTNRFTWPEELHRLFIAAIFDVGLKNASPKALLELMGERASEADLTTEHLKSHLQKYRVHYDRSKNEFLSLYDQAFLNKAKEINNEATEISTNYNFPILPNGYSRKNMFNRENIQNIIETKLDISENENTQSEYQENIQNILNENRMLQNAYELHKAKRNRIAINADSNVIQTRGIKINQHHFPAPSQIYRSTMPSNVPLSADHRLSTINHLYDSTYSVVDQTSHLEMHMAMQSQMNLHRQMLLRKVEVSQNGSLSSDMEQPKSPPNTNANVRDDSYIGNDNRNLLPEGGDSLSNHGAADVFDLGWDKLSLDIDMEDDDLFGFLKC